jgi:hypothetical protein
VTNILHEIYSKIKIGDVIEKPTVKAEILKMQKSDGITHSIGKNKSFKKVKDSDFEKAFKILQSNGCFTRKDFNDVFERPKNRSCDFTTMGSIFNLLGYAEYAGIKLGYKLIK